MAKVDLVHPGETVKVQAECRASKAGVSRIRTSWRAVHFNEDLSCFLSICLGINPDESAKSGDVSKGIIDRRIT
jgi:hypothetical protein